MEFVHKVIATGYSIIIVIVIGIAYIWYCEWQNVEALEVNNRQIDKIRTEIDDIHIQLIEFSLFGETVLEWGKTDLEKYHEGVSKCAPSFFMHKAPTFTSRGFVIT